MGTVTNLLLCSFVIVVIAQDGVILEADMPLLKVQLNNPATLNCCCHTKMKSLTFIWIKSKNRKKEPLVRGTTGNKTVSEKLCGTLTFKFVMLNDSGLYQCFLNGSKLYTYGTYLQVYKPLEKTINLSENTKNKILTAEGILLFLCVLLPAATLLCQSKKLNELEKKKVKKEEENIYQGLNLDDCCATYDQIERSQAHGPYQDACNIKEEDEEEEIQLEKP